MIGHLHGLKRVVLVVTPVTAIDLNEIDIPDSNSPSFENLPANWQIPLKDIKFVAEDGQPKILGRGGYGLVYHAFIRAEQAAIKIIQGGSKVKQAKLLHEIKVLEQCRSDYVVQFRGFSVSPVGLLLCMELLPRGTLFQALTSSDEFQWYKRYVPSIEWSKG